MSPPAHPLPRPPPAPPAPRHPSPVLTPTRLEPPCMDCKAKPRENRTCRTDVNQKAQEETHTRAAVCRLHGDQNNVAQVNKILQRSVPRCKLHCKQTNLRCVSAGSGRKGSGAKVPRPQGSGPESGQGQGRPRPSKCVVIGV